MTNNYYFNNELVEQTDIPDTAELYVRVNQESLKTDFWFYFSSDFLQELRENPTPLYP